MLTSLISLAFHALLIPAMMKKRTQSHGQTGDSKGLRSTLIINGGGIDGRVRHFSEADFWTSDVIIGGWVYHGIMKGK